MFQSTVRLLFNNNSQLFGNLWAGEVEVRLRFIPSTISATDDANLSTGAPYRLQSFLQFEFESTPQLRGFDGLFSMAISDHRGETVRNTAGDFDFLFNNSWFNTTSNLTGQHQQIINLDANLVADDYAIAVSYNGSDDYAPSSGVVY